MKLKKEWSKEEFTKVNNALVKFFGNKTFINHRGEKVFCPKSLSKLNMLLGLPYTSTGAFACFSLSCNVQLFESKRYYFDCAAISEANEVVLILSDNEENEKFIII
jgi:hypothetical protein